MGKLIFASSNAVVSGSRNLCKKCVGFSIYLNLFITSSQSHPTLGRQDVGKRVPQMKTL